MLFVSYSGVLGGAERILLDIAGAAPGAPVLACPEGPLAVAARSAGLPVRVLPERPLALRGGVAPVVAAARLAGHAREVRAIARELRPGVVVAWNMRSAMAAAAAFPAGRRPRLVFQHNDLAPGRAVGRAVRLAARRADRVVALSAAIAQDVDPSGQVGVEVVHPGVDLDRFAPAPAATGPPAALLLGAIVPWKRPDLALEAVARARAERPELRLIVAGAPLDAVGERLLEHLRARAAAADLAGAVEFAGQLADARSALARAAVLLHAADAEPFGMALVEALAGGRPVVAPAAGGPLEIVEPSCGELYAPADSAAAAAALLRTLDRLDAGEPLGAAARERAERAFDLNTARARWLHAVLG